MMMAMMFTVMDSNDDNNYVFFVERGHDEDNWININENYMSE